MRRSTVERYPYPMAARLVVPVALLVTASIVNAADQPKTADKTDAPARKITSPQTGQLKSIRVIGDTRFHHADSVSHLFVMPDGKRVISSARDGTARLWDLNTGAEIRRFHQSGDDDVWNVQWLPGKKQILTAGGDDHITRWDLETGKQLARYKQGDTVLRLAVFDQERQFVAVGSGGKIIQWNIESGKQVRTLKGQSTVYSVSMSPDGRSFVTGGDKQAVRFWQTSSGKLMQEIKTQTDSVYTVAHAPDGKVVASCSDNGAVLLFTAPGGKRLWKAQVSNGATVLTWSPDGKSLAVSSDDGHLHVLGRSDGKVRFKIPVPGDNHWPVAYSHDGRYLYSSGDQIIYRWDAATGKQLFPDPANNHLRGQINALALSSDGAMWLAGEDANLRLCNQEGKQLRRLSQPQVVERLDLSDDGSKLLAVDDDMKAWVVDTRTGRKLSEVSHKDRVSAAAFILGGKRVVTAGDNKMVWIWDSQSGRRVSSVSGISDYIKDIAVSKNGLMFVSVSNDRAIQLWNSSTGEQLDSIEGPDGGASLCALSGDSHYLLAVGDDNTLYCFQSPTRRSPRPPTPEQIKQLIKDLGSDRFSVRQEATIQLIGAAEAASPYLKQADTSDPEIAYRMRQIRSGITKLSLPTQSLGTGIKLGGYVRDLSIHPDGRHWAATVGLDVNNKIILGRITDKGPVTLSRTSDGHGHEKIKFSADGKRLYSGNLDGSVTIYQLQ